MQSRTALQQGPPWGSMGVRDRLQAQKRRANWAVGKRVGQLELPLSRPVHFCPVCVVFASCAGHRRWRGGGGEVKVTKEEVHAS